MCVINELYDEINISPKPNNRYKLNKEFKYKDITIPENFETNGANIPRLLWVIWPPNKSDYLPAIIIHDYLCNEEKYHKADLYLKDVMKELKINKTTIYLFYLGVRLYHMIKYRK